MFLFSLGPTRSNKVPASIPTQPQWFPGPPVSMWVCPVPLGTGLFQLLSKNRNVGLVREPKTS